MTQKETLNFHEKQVPSTEQKNPVMYLSQEGYFATVEKYQNSRNIIDSKK